MQTSIYGSAKVGTGLLCAIGHDHFTVVDLSELVTSYDVYDVTRRRVIAANCFHT